jgi:hypothetical protein
MIFAEENLFIFYTAVDVSKPVSKGGGGFLVLTLPV